MKQISFALTTDQVRRRQKTVTRRVGWRQVTVGELLQPIVQGQGLKKGERVRKIGRPITLVDVRREPLRRMLEDLEYGAAEVIAEGFDGDPEKGTPEGFVRFFCASHGCTPDTEITRLEFEYDARAAVDPWNAATHAAIDAREPAGKHFIYLLVDDDGAQLLIDGIVPDYVQRQARSALEWTLADCGQKAAGW